MATYLLTWNPKRWDWAEQAECIERLQRTGSLRRRWSCGVNRSIVDGDRIFLLQLGEEPKGILGSGVVRGAVFEDAHWNPEEHTSEKLARYVEVDFDYLAAEPVIHIDELSHPPVLFGELAAAEFGHSHP